MGLATVLGLRQQGFFIPYRHADLAVPGAYPALESRFAANDARFLEFLAEIESWSPEFRMMSGPVPEPRFDQDWFPRLDAGAAYAMVRRAAPRRILEIGSGHSTRFLARAVSDGELSTRLTCIDPAPRASLKGLPVEWMPVLMQDAPAQCYSNLESGDILFVDSSHILMPGTDVDRLLNHVLPVLDPGVIVHIHDIFLPEPYPTNWAWRGYNEQSAVALLIQDESYELLFASHFVASRHADRLGSGALAELPLLDSAFECSLWLQKKAPS